VWAENHRQAKTQQLNNHISRGRFSEWDSGPCFFMLFFGKAAPERTHMREEKLIAYLRGAFKGRNKTIKSAELERAMEMSGTDLRKLVNKLRRKSVPICSGADGYFYAKTAGDILRTIRQLKVMIKGLQAAVDGLEAALDKFVEPDSGGEKGGEGTV